MDIPDPWVREQTGIPQPAPGEAISVSGRAVMNPRRSTGKHCRKNRKRQSRQRWLPDCRKRKAAPEMNWTTWGMRCLARRLQEAIDPVLEPVIDAIRTRGLADALADLPALYREMDDSPPDDAAQWFHVCCGK